MVLKLRVDKVTKEFIEETWFVGPDVNHLQHAGRLTFRTGEYQLIGAALLIGAKEVNKNYPRFLIINEDTLFTDFHNPEKGGSSNV